ncbi:sugar ABC transporter permease [Halomonas sp. McH1-25]|uniref:carbohydrate ABC transporter permease n=1 Tax=unclassified Halomonas TaxID=2609666 RepID=UPI001EF6B971|nr:MULTISPECIES: sugar ABC transporter permease [unclassified Halomonas]MCG7601077.1 sugar ABC transporter permease [Halomonas sp. McH1-25]MCP1343866.1 sugar ABC transporter permease [Halomonas sp. FL8]MCP1361241.1 sugar ABC transporter permease [Halomonas sp. BBD45]MCP1364533.1 sugar ABC transporter permease [Halomonas sp. BBD48]
MNTLTRHVAEKRGLAMRMRKGMVSGKLAAMLLLLPPALILFSLFVILPLADAAYYSVFSWNGYGAPSDFVGTQNYARLLDHSVFHTALWNTAKLILVSLLVQMPLALGLALLVYRKTPTNTLFRLVFFLPYILAEVAAGLIWSFVFDGDYGITAFMFQALGQESVYVLADRQWAFPAIMTVIVWKYFGFHMMIYIAALQSVPKDLIEAAKLEGAKPRQVALFVQIPMIKHAIVVSGFFAIIGSLQIFDIIIPLTNGGPSNTTHTIVTYLYTFGLSRLNIGFGSAAAVVLFILAIGIAFFYQRTTAKGGQA